MITDTEIRNQIQAKATELNQAIKAMNEVKPVRVYYKRNKSGLLRALIIIPNYKPVIKPITK